MVFYVVLYAVAALVREVMAIWYYRSIIEKLAFWASMASFLIELVDLTVLSSLVILLMRMDGLKRAVPALTYAVFGSVGVYLGVKFRGRRK